MTSQIPLQISHIKALYCFRGGINEESRTSYLLTEIAFPILLPNMYTSVFENKNWIDIKF